MPIKAAFCYNQQSQGGLELSKALGIPRIKHSGSTFVGSSAKTILNWGATTERFPSNLMNCKIINNPQNVDLAVNKIKSFEKFKELNVPHPEWTRNKEEALQWVESGTLVFARTKLTSHSGKGIVLMDPDHPDTWEVNAELYVKEVKKKDEYRIHVCNGSIIDTQRKGLKQELAGTEGINWKIRNLANGFIYVRNDGRVVPECVLENGLRAVQSLGLDFGAADVIYNQGQDKAYALEVNSAPGLQGTTLANYKLAMEKF